jgi:hypothetical protein
MNMKWEEVQEDHNYYDFDKQENMNLRISPKKMRKKSIMEKKNKNITGL